MRRILKVPETLIILASLWIALTCNYGFWRIIVENSPSGDVQPLIYFTGFLLLTVGLINLVLLILSSVLGVRVTLSLSLFIAAVAGYFTARYGTLFDVGMLVNAVETNQSEAFELVSPSLIAVLFILGVIPAIVVWRYPFATRSVPAAVVQKSTAVILAVSLIVGPILVNQKEIFSVARNHQELRHMIAPLNVISASYIYTRELLEPVRTFRHIAVDAKHANNSNHDPRPSVHVLIIGETARAANFSLNGYAQNTNPELAGQKGIHFVEAAACGTATAVSLPCMLSIQEHDDFNREDSHYEDSLLDVVARSGYDVYWIDNGNGCKGLCSHVSSRDVHGSPGKKAVCPDSECFDEILVEELDAQLASIERDTLIVLHQLGSHGPAYFRRYPDEFAVFSPECRSANFGDCTQAEIRNSYDNTIVYTDHVISAAIDVLKAHADEIDGSLIYMSDHGESLGESNMYLHGMPYALAPPEQTRVPMIYWSAGDLREGREFASMCTQDAVTARPISHDNLFHTELGLLKIETAAYKPDLDMFARCSSDIVMAEAS